MKHQPAFVADQPAPSPEQISAPDLAPNLAEALADELVLLTTMLSDLAYDLGSDPQTLRRHLSSLQAIDRITQSQITIADLLRSNDNIETRLANITLQDMATRLRNRLG